MLHGRSSRVRSTTSQPQVPVPANQAQAQAQVQAVAAAAVQNANPPPQPQAAPIGPTGIYQRFRQAMGQPSLNQLRAQVGPAGIYQRLRQAVGQPSLNQLQAQVGNWWIASPEARRASTLHNYQAPPLLPEASTLTSLRCIEELEKINRLREPILLRLKHMLDDSTPAELAPDRGALIKHYQMTLEIHERSKEYIKRYLERRKDPRPADPQAQGKRFSEAVATYDRLNVVQKDVLEFLCDKLENVNAESLRYKPQAKAAANTLALKFFKDHFVFSAGLALSAIAIRHPDWLNYFNWNTKVFSIGVPALYLLGGIAYGGPMKAAQDAGKAAKQSMQTFGSAYASNSLILGAVGAAIWPSHAYSILAAHAALFTGQFIYNNSKTIADDARDVFKKAAFKASDLIKGYVRNSVILGAIPAVGVGLFNHSWGWGAGVYGVHVLAAGMFKLAEAEE